MSTLVLARKYRPRNFAQMAGQEHVVRALTNALEQRRLHHAYLFTGTRGIGKTTVSRILAKCLNCTGPDGGGGITAEPCGVCPACVEIDADRYIDYIELDAASNRGIDDARDLIERAAYKPSVGRYKVFMIDEAHQLTKDAFNALLKTLEEPPEHLKFVLATTDPEKMLPTVLSRCLQFNLRPMAPEVVRAHLQQVLQAESIDFDHGALRLLAHAARGSMRDALSLTDQAIAYGAGALQEAAVGAMLGIVGADLPPELVRALARRDGGALLQACERVREAGLSGTATLERVAQLLQQMAIEQAAPGALDEDDPLAAAARDLAPLMAADEIQLLYGIVLHGRQELAWMSDESAAFTMVMLRYLAFPPAAGAPAAAPAPAPARSAPLRATAPPATAVRPGAGAPQPVVPARAATAPPTPAPEADPALADRWESIVRTMTDRGEVSGLVRELAWQSQLLAIEGAAPARWRIAAEHEALRTQGLCDKLNEVLATALGEDLRLRIEPGQTPDSPARRDARERARRQQVAEQTILADPDVQTLMSQFKTARIVPGSIKPT